MLLGNSVFSDTFVKVGMRVIYCGTAWLVLQSAWQIYTKLNIFIFFNIYTIEAIIELIYQYRLWCCVKNLTNVKKTTRQEVIFFLTTFSGLLRTYGTQRRVSRCADHKHSTQVSWQDTSCRVLGIRNILRGFLATI